MPKISKFINEGQVYDLLRQASIEVPKYFVINSIEEILLLSFDDDQEIVIKGMADNLWHKSDVGALEFCKFRPKEIKQCLLKIKANIESKFQNVKYLVCEKVNYLKNNLVPVEGFLSIKKDPFAGYIINVGFGGILAETWAKELKSKILIWPIDLMTPELAYDELKNHLLGKIWLGNLRQTRPLISEDTLKKNLSNIWILATQIKNKNIDLLEINPMVIDVNGNPVALDGVGEYGEKELITATFNVNYNKLLNPKRVAVAGVSDKTGSFGKKIIENLLDSDLDHKDIKIIKPDIKSFMGIECYQDVSVLLNNPVDVMVVSLPAKITISLLEQLCMQGGGADIIYIVAGGIGDGADKDGRGEKIIQLLQERRNKNEWTPVLIGPNSLGIVLGPNKINTLFLDKKRLPIKFHPNGNIALISQSGAFLITRLSSDDDLPVKYGFAIGSQTDFKATDWLEAVSLDNDVKVIAFYLEGFAKNNATLFAKKAKELRNSGKYVVLYKGGRSFEGMKAASGHTGAMAGNFELQEKLFKEANIYLCYTMKNFSTLLTLLSHSINLNNAKSIGMITNAGFEAVCAADQFGDIKSLAGKMMNDIDNSSKLEDLLLKHKLNGLVAPTNPLDLTPMASEQAFIDSVCFMCENFDIVILSIVPFTERLSATDKNTTEKFAKELKKIRDEYRKDIIVVVDAGNLYDMYREQIESNNFPVFRTIEEPFTALSSMFIDDFKIT